MFPSINIVKESDQSTKCGEIQSKSDDLIMHQQYSNDEIINAEVQVLSDKNETDSEKIDEKNDEKTDPTRETLADEQVEEENITRSENIAEQNPNDKEDFIAGRRDSDDFSDLIQTDEIGEENLDESFYGQNPDEIEPEKFGENSFGDERFGSDSFGNDGFGPDKPSTLRSKLHNHKHNPRNEDKPRNKPNYREGDYTEEEINAALDKLSNFKALG